jgi:hypothetical protein
VSTFGLILAKLYRGITGLVVFRRFVTALVKNGQGACVMRRILRDLGGRVLRGILGITVRAAKLKYGLATTVLNKLNGNKENQVGQGGSERVDACEILEAFCSQGWSSGFQISTGSTSMKDGYNELAAGL